MSKFFFDWADDDPAIIDGLGMEFASADDAIAEGTLALGEVAKDAISRLTTSGRRGLTLSIRNALGNTIFRCQIAMTSMVAD